MHSKLLAITPLVLTALAVPAPAATDTRRDLSLSQVSDLEAIGSDLESSLPKSALAFAAEKRDPGTTVVSVLDNLLSECSPLVAQIGSPPSRPARPCSLYQKPPSLTLSTESTIDSLDAAGTVDDLTSLLDKLVGEIGDAVHDITAAALNGVEGNVQDVAGLLKRVLELVDRVERDVGAAVGLPGKPSLLPFFLCCSKKRTLIPMSCSGRDAKARRAERSAQWLSGRARESCGWVAGCFGRLAGRGHAQGIEAAGARVPVVS